MSRTTTMGTSSAEPVGRPWYVQFWPLFLVFLMVASIVGSLATVAIAYRHADVDVRASEAAALRAPVVDGASAREADRAGDESPR